MFLTTGSIMNSGQIIILKTRIIRGHIMEVSLKSGMRIGKSFGKTILKGLKMILGTVARYIKLLTA